MSASPERASVGNVASGLGEGTEAEGADAVG